MSHWSKKYLGRKWRKDYDCYAFFVEVQRVVFNVTYQLDFVAPGFKSRSKAVAFVNGSEDIKKYWDRVDTPEEGDAVLFGNAVNTFHIGVWAVIGGQSGVLHCSKGHGVIFTPRKHMVESFTQISSILRSKK